MASAGRLRYSAVMLSVIIETRNDEDGLARTLSSLVSGAVQGVVREVIVCDRGSTDRTHGVAEHAGCHFIAEGGVAAGIGRARSEWLLLLEPGARLVDGWLEGVADHVARTTMPARFSRSRSARAPFLSRVFSGNRALAQGLLITTRQAAGLFRNARDAEGLGRGLATKLLPGEILPAAPGK